MVSGAASVSASASLFSALVLSSIDSVDFFGASVVAWNDETIYVTYINISIHDGAPHSVINSIYLNRMKYNLSKQSVARQWIEISILNYTNEKTNETNSIYFYVGSCVL